MDLDVITTVLTVAKTKSFSAAAFMIPCAQSSVSRRVESAESELNVKLFSRPADSLDRTVSLTSAGEKIIPVMQKIVENYQQMFAFATDAGNEQSVIRIGVKNNMMPPMAFTTMKADFFEMHPHIAVEIQFSGMDVLISELKNHQLDAVLFTCVSIDPESFPLRNTYDLVHLGDVGLSIGISNQNPLSRRPSVTIPDLKNETFLMKDAKSDSYMGIRFSDYSEFCHAVAEKYGFQIRATMMNDAMLEIRYRLAQKNRGVFPSHTPPCWRTIPGITYVNVENDSHSISYYLLSQKNTKTQALRAFSSYLSSRINEPHEEGVV